MILGGKAMKSKLRKFGIEIGDQLGRGVYGSVFEAEAGRYGPGSKVVKITAQRDEARLVAWALKLKAVPRALPRFYDVFSFEQLSRTVYVILREDLHDLRLTNISPHRFREAMIEFEDILEGRAERDLSRDEALDQIRDVAEEVRLGSFDKYLPQMVKFFQWCISEKIVIGDLHEDNWSIRPGTDHLVARDLGYNDYIPRDRRPVIKLNGQAAPRDPAQAAREINLLIEKLDRYGYREEPLPRSWQALLIWSNGSATWHVRSVREKVEAIKSKGGTTIKLDANYLVAPYRPKVVQVLVDQGFIKPHPLYGGSYGAKVRAGFDPVSGFTITTDLEVMAMLHLDVIALEELRGQRDSLDQEEFGELLVRRYPDLPGVFLARMLDWVKPVRHSDNPCELYRYEEP